MRVARPALPHRPRAARAPGGGPGGAPAAASLRGSGAVRRAPGSGIARGAVEPPERAPPARRVPVRAAACRMVRVPGTPRPARLAPGLGGAGAARALALPPPLRRRLLVAGVRRRARPGSRLDGAPPPAPRRGRLGRVPDLAPAAQLVRVLLRSPARGDSRGSGLRRPALALALAPGRVAAAAPRVAPARQPPARERGGPDLLRQLLRGRGRAGLAAGGPRAPAPGAAGADPPGRGPLRALADVPGAGLLRA